MFRRLPAYLALAMISVACTGGEDDQTKAIEDQEAPAPEEAAAAVVEDDQGAVAASVDGKALYTPCAACHGANGEGNMALNAPGIAGQSESYLKRQLWEFKNGQRGNHEGDVAGAQMRPMAATLADGEAITAVAAYVASMPATVPPVTVEGDAANGEKLYVSKCGACHGGRAWGNEALYTPRLTMLGDAYIVRQVRNFQEGMRGTADGGMYGQQMAASAKLVTEQELMDIVAFINELAAEE